MFASVPSVKVSKVQYGNFLGLNTSRSEIAGENNEGQIFSYVENAFVDWTGFVSNERGMDRVGKEGRYISHVRYGYSGEILYAVRSGDKTRLFSTEELDHGRGEGAGLFDNPVVTSTVSNGAAVFCGGEKPYYYESKQFKPIESEDAYGATLCASVSGRLALAGFSFNPTLIRFSRVDDNTIFECDEDPGDIQVTRAGFLDVRLSVDRAERITALFPFGADQLLVFTDSRCLAFSIPSDLSLWKQVSDVHIYVGCVSQNSICGWANEVVFCSRYGIYTLKRSVASGRALVVQPYSHQIQPTYQQLIHKMENPELISSVMDSDSGRCHFCFPLSPRESYRISCSVTPKPAENSKDTEALGNAIWSLSHYGALTCGDSYNGNLIFGSTGGLWSMRNEYEMGGDIGVAEFHTPILWVKDPFRIKRTHQLSVIADGAGQVEVTVENEKGEELDVVRFDFPEEDQAFFLGEKKGRAFERPLFHLFVGLKLKFKILNVKTRVRIYGFSFDIKEQ